MLVSKLYLDNLLSVDKLHYKEVKILNDLHELVLKKKKKKIDSKLEQLVADVELHFEKEEKRMFKYNYPAANKHQYAHHCSLQKLYEARREWRRNKDVGWLKVYLESGFTPWLNGHIMSMDKLACDYLVEAGSN